MDDRRPALVLCGTLTFSVAAHLVSWLALTILPAPSETLAMDDDVSLEVVELPPEPVIEEPPPEPEPEAPAPEPEPPEPEVRPEPRPRLVEEPPPDAPPPDVPPPPQEEAIEDFTGVTLANDSDNGWTTAMGNGAAIDAPLGQPGGLVTGRRREGVPNGAIGGTGPPTSDVALADLSRAPTLADQDRLQRLLAQHYPRDARELGIEGDAVVRIRIRATGRAQVLAVMREDHAGFGDACRRTLREGGEFVPPLDRQGREVDTITQFRCTFSIRF